VPGSLKKLIFEFEYNNLGSLQKIFEENPRKVAAVILEPVGIYAPQDNFLTEVAKLTRKNGALLIFDEIITGFRLSLGGAQSYFSVTPDLSAFGKAMANGYPISVLVGKKEIMDSVENKVFISSTYGGDLLSITAAIKTIKILQEKKVNDYILALGQRLKDGLNAVIQEHKINAQCEGMPHKTFLIFGDTGGVSGNMVETLFRQECLARGVFLGYGHFICFAHKPKDIKYTLDTAVCVFGIVRRALNRGNLPVLLKGKLASDVFKRY
jgi:glutamate-1-semialdehyde aminotransferase